MEKRFPLGHYMEIRRMVIRSLLAAMAVSALFVSGLSAQGGRGIITGRVIDSTTQQALPSATVQVVDTARGTLTRNDGGFTLTDVPSGPQRLRVARK